MLIKKKRCNASLSNVQRKLSVMELLISQISIKDLHENCLRHGCFPRHCVRKFATTLFTRRHRNYSMSDKPKISTLLSKKKSDKNFLVILSNKMLIFRFTTRACVLRLSGINGFSKKS